MAFFLCIAATSHAQQSTPSHPPPPGTLLDIGGYRVHVCCSGSGSPTVMIVGAAFSFDWDLVQSSVSKFTRVCTFYPSGTAWSDPFQNAAHVLHSSVSPQSLPTCDDRVAEIRRVITHASVDRPYILVGFSVGALWERLYAARYPEEIAGIVIVDHAFLPDNTAPRAHPASPSTSLQNAGGPVLLAQTPLVFGFEDDVNFVKLPQQDQELHKWALAQHPVRPNQAMAADCFAQIDHATGSHPYPFGDIPLTVIRTENDSPGYAELQAKLLSLSRRSRQVVAWNSSHMVPIDQPETIVSAIQTMVETVAHTKAKEPRPQPGLKPVE